MVAANRSPLSRTVIADAALVLIEEHGFDYLTMRRLGENLGIDAMSLYYYFDNKDDLLDAMLDRLYDSVVISELDAGSGNEFASWLRAIRRMFEHPAAHELYTKRVASSPAGPRGVLWSGTRLLQRGLTPAEAAKAYRLICSFVTGFASSSMYVSAIAEAAKDAPEADDLYVSEFLCHLQQADEEETFEAGLNMLATVLISDLATVTAS